MGIRIVPETRIPTVGEFMRSLAHGFFNLLGEIALYLDSLPLEKKQPLKDFMISSLTRSRKDKKTLAFWAKEDEELESCLVGRSWWVLHKDITGNVKRELLRFGREGNSDQIDAYLCSQFRDQDLFKLRARTQVWFEVAYLADRRQVILDCLEAHKAGKYTLTIPALLPLADGLVRCFRKTYARPRNGKNGKQTMQINRFAEYYRRREHKAWSASFEKFLRQIAYVPFEFGQERPPSSLNRHGILHGEIPDYASEANSLRVFLMLDTIAQFVRALEKRLSVGRSASPRRGIHSESRS